MLPAHKEERFLFVVYPVICFAAAVTLLGVWHGLERLFPRQRKVTTMRERVTMKDWVFAVLPSPCVCWVCLRDPAAVESLHVY